MAAVLWSLLLLCCLCRCKAAIVGQHECGEADWDSAAQQAFQYYAQHVRPKWTALTGERNFSAVVAGSNADFTRTLGDNSKQQCLVEYIYRHKRNRIRIGRWYKAHGSCDNVKTRAEVIFIIIKHLISQPGANHFTHDFRWWYDLTDSTVLPERTASFLSFPILSFGRALDVHIAMPTPELYMMYAMIADSRAMMDAMRSLTIGNRNHVNLAKQMHQIFRYTLPVQPWEEKVPKAVYRGSCFPTFNPHGHLPGQPPVLFLRGQLCEASKPAGRKHLYDVGLNIVASYTDNCNPTNPFFRDLCAGCKPCTGLPKMNRTEMIGHKYQIIVDGYGPTFDSVYWKLASNSVTMLFMESAQPPVPYYSQWFFPLLTAKTHYLPVTTLNLDETLAWFDDIATNARNVMLCSVTLESAQRYLTKVLQMVHDTQGHLGNGAVLGKRYTATHRTDAHVW